MRTTLHPQLPQLDGGTFLTDAGLETELVFHDGRELPAFAAFPLLDDEEGRARLRRYFDGFAAIAADRGLGLVLETPTWRASSRWGRELGIDDPGLDRLNRSAVALLEEVRDAWTGDGPVVLAGILGPQDDAYDPATRLSEADAEEYHAPQIATFADTAADMVHAMTISYAEEAIGIARAAQALGIPAAISFTVETDGRLPSGQDLGAAIEQVDDATEQGPAYFGINCAHPTHFDAVLEPGGPWVHRIRGLRANASTRSHAELDEAETLDDGDPADLAARYAGLRERLPALAVLGGCCGTDARHVAAIAAAWPAGPAA